MPKANIKKYRIKGKKCKKCGYRMTKLYRHQNKPSQKRWIPIVWYCKECDKLGDRIK
jgi:C4-type Zn-finger protein